MTVSGTLRRPALKAFALALLAAVAVSGTAACGREDESAATSEGGLTSGPGFDGKTITVGVQAALTGPVAVVGQPAVDGLKVWAEGVNAEGGVAGQYPVKLDVTDNRRETALAVQLYNKQKDDVVMFAQLFGTPVTAALLPQLTEAGIVASPLSFDAAWVREQYLAPFAAPFQIQIINGMAYYLREEGDPSDRVCTMVTDDAAGQATEEGARFAAEDMGFEIVADVRYPLGAEDVSAQIKQLRSAGCEVVLFAGGPGDTPTALGAAKEVGFAPRWIGQSVTWIDVLADSPLREYLEEHFWVVDEVPAWGDDSIRGMAEMVAQVDRYAPDQKPNRYFVYGYVQGKLTEAILEKAVELGSLSRGGIVEAMNSLGRVSFGDLAGTYEYGPPADRQPPRTNTVYEVAAGEPYGLSALVTGFTSEAAERFEFNE